MGVVVKEVISVVELILLVIANVTAVLILVVIVTSKICDRDVG